MKKAFLAALRIHGQSCPGKVCFFIFFFLFIKTTLTLVTELSESVIECRLSRRDENCAFFSGKNVFSVTLNHREKYFIKQNSNNHAPQTPSWILSISCLSKQLQSVSFQAENNTETTTDIGADSVMYTTKCYNTKTLILLSSPNISFRISAMWRYLTGKKKMIHQSEVRGKYQISIDNSSLFVRFSEAEPCMIGPEEL